MITESTGVSIGVLLAVFGGIITIVAMIVNMRRDIRALFKAGDDKLSMERASELALRTAIENPGHRMPDPRDPNRVIVVERREGHHSAD